MKTTFILVLILASASLPLAFSASQVTVTQSSGQTESPLVIKDNSGTILFQVFNDGKTLVNQFIKFSQSGLSTIKTYVFPNSNGIIVLQNTTDTFTGTKTFGTTTPIGRLAVAGATSGSTIINASAVAGSSFVTLPTSGTLATLENTETFTGVKTMSGQNVIKTSNTGLIVRNVAGTFTTTLAGGANTGNTTLTLPINTATLATLTGTETLSSKTLTSPTINGGKINFTRTTIGTSSTVVATTGINVIDLANGNYTVTLPTSSGNIGQTVTIVSNSTSPNRNWLMIDAFGTQLIDGTLNLNFTKNLDYATLVSDGVGWTVLDTNKDSVDNSSIMRRNGVYSQPLVAGDSWITLFSTGTAVSSKTPSGTAIEAFPLFITRTTTFDRIGLSVSTAAVQTCRVGIYTADERGYPFKLVTGSDVGTLSTALPIRVNNTFSSPITLKPDMYFLANECSAASSNLLRGVILANQQTSLGWTSASPPASISGYSAPFTYAAFPATYPSGASYFTGTQTAVFLRPVG